MEIKPKEKRTKLQILGIILMAVVILLSLLALFQ